MEKLYAELIFGVRALLMIYTDIWGESFTDDLY
jgi:hypothetical protein